MREISVAYDRETFLNQRFGGISKAFFCVINELSMNSNSKIEPVFSFTRTDNVYLQELRSRNFLPARKFFSAKSGWSTLATLGPIHNYSAIWAGGTVPRVQSDILHATYYRPTYKEQARSNRLVVTVHDFIPEKLGWNGLRNPHIGKKKLCRQADLIICVSKATAVDLQNYYEVPDHKVQVIHHGVAPDLIAVPKHISTMNGAPSILYVGHRAGYKNFEVLLSAIRLGIAKKIELQLITAGPQLTSEEISTNADLIGKGVWQHLDTPSDLELRELYRNSTIHCVTSKMEGFGMTILEAMSSGTPVILSQIPVFEEVAGDVGVYFDPNSEEDLLDKVVHILAEGEYLRLSLKCLDYVTGKGWDKTANEHEKQYVRVMEGSYF